MLVTSSYVAAAGGKSGFSPGCHRMARVVMNNFARLHCGPMFQPTETVTMRKYHKNPACSARYQLRRYHFRI
jgi:hypothetical protein